MYVATRLDHKFLEFNSLRYGEQRALYLGNGNGDQSQIWSKVSSNVVLCIYTAIAIFAKIALCRVFPDQVTLLYALKKKLRV